MNARNVSIVTAIAAALLAPTLSMADSPWVPANNNQGYRYQPDHGTATKGVEGRSAIGAVTADARVREGAPTDTSSTTATGKTREQVRNELLNMSAAEKQRLQELNRN